jgi:hypothetical protein
MKRASQPIFSTNRQRSRLDEKFERNNNLFIQEVLTKVSYGSKLTAQKSQSMKVG